MRIFRWIAVLAVVLAAPAFAETPEQGARNLRIDFLERKLEQVKQEQAKANLAHDAWLNNQAAPIPPQLLRSSLRTGREDWSNALRQIWHISDEVYPNDAGPALMTSPGSGLPETDRMVHRANALPEIQKLVDRMTAEIAALKAQNQ